MELNIQEFQSKTLYVFDTETPKTEFPYDALNAPDTHTFSLDVASAYTH